MPLSPLARTPSPSPIATSPTRSPSPLTLGHVAGSSNMTQTYQPSTHGASHSGTYVLMSLIADFQFKSKSGCNKQNYHLTRCFASSAWGARSPPPSSASPPPPLGGSWWRTGSLHLLTPWQTKIHRYQTQKLLWGTFGRLAEGSRIANCFLA